MADLSENLLRALRDRERVISGAAITLYAGSFLSMIWMYAHDAAREPEPADPTGLDGTGWLVLMFVIPLLVGFGVGRYWALALILFLIISTVVVVDLEPLQRPEPSEVENGPPLMALFTAVVHAPLLVIGAWLRKRLWPRAPSRKWRLPTAV